MQFIRHSLNFLLCIIVALAIMWPAAWKLAGASLLSVQSGSMSPLISRGDLLIDIKPKTVRPGDIVTYRSLSQPGQSVTHRIIAANARNQTITTKGDNIKTADPPVSSSAITGKVFKIVPNAGYVYDALRRPLGLVLMVYLPALLIIIFELWSLAVKLNYQSYSLLKST